MELGNLYIYTGPEKTQCLTLAEGSFARAFPVKAEANAKLCGCWQIRALQAGKLSRARGTFDLQPLQRPRLCCEGNPTQNTPAVQAGGCQMCCQTGLVALLFGSHVAPEVFDVRRIHNGKNKAEVERGGEKQLDGMQRETKVIFFPLYL